MSLFARLERRDVLPLQATNVGTIFNWSNETVNETTALSVAAVFSAVSLLADSVASLPIRVYRTQNGLTTEQPLPGWLRNPNALSTPFELMHQIVSSMALHGNAYVLLDHNERRDIIGVEALHPNNVTVWTGNGRTRSYSVAGGQIDPADMLHIRWWTPAQAVKGLSPLEMQKTTIGLALAMERHLAQFYGEGATPSSVLETDTNLTPEQAQVLRETWTNTHNRHRRPAVLTQGLKWKPITVSAADMELNETRELQIAQVARVFRVPAYLIGARGDSQTYQNNEGAGQHFVTYTLLPWLRRIEVALSALLPAPQYVRFDTEAFLRADTLTRFQAHQLGIASGFRTPNEARRVEGLEPYEGGDEFVMALPGSPMASPSNPTMPPVGTDQDPTT